MCKQLYLHVDIYLFGQVEVTEKAESLDSFQDSMAATQAQQSSEDVEHESGDFAKYGSKIEKCRAPAAFCEPFSLWFPCDFLAPRG